MSLKGHGIGGHKMTISTIEGAATTRHEHKFDFEEATTTATIFRCTVCGHLLHELEDAGTGA